MLILKDLFKVLDGTRVKIANFASQHSNALLNKNSETAIRVKSGLIFGFIFILSLLLGGLIFDVLMLLFAVIIFDEWKNMIKSTEGVQHKYWYFGGIVYTVLPIASLINIRHFIYGGSILFWYFAVIWATDCGAYFIGRKVGGRKLAPAISPGKTVSGASGGILCAFIVGILFTLTVRNTKFGDLGVIGLGIVACIIAILAQSSDLLESYLKRRFNIKDTGNIMPGHGGLMDRMDSITLSAPFLLLLLS